MVSTSNRPADLFASAEARNTELRSDEHRATAAPLHELWESRFPDRILAEGATPDGHLFALAPIDRLFCAGFRAAGLNPAAFTQRLGPDAMQAVLAENPEKAFFG